MGIEQLSLRGQLNPLVRPQKQLAAQLPLQQLHRMGHVWLAAVKDCRRLGDIAAPCHLVEYPIMLHGNCHISSSIN